MAGEELVGAQRAKKLARIKLTKHCTAMQKALDKTELTAQTGSILQKRALEKN